MVCAEHSQAQSALQDPVLPGEYVQMRNSGHMDPSNL